MQPTFWPGRLTARTQDFHSCNRGSIPRRAAKTENKIMAHHKSALKRIRQNRKRRLHNRFYHKMTRTYIKKLRKTEDYDRAVKLMPQVISLIDKLAKRGIIHKNKAANLKSKLMKHVHKLSVK